MFKSKKTKRKAGEVNTGSTADIAFLLLIFFLVTTQIASDVGIPMMLPPNEPPTSVILNERNVLNVLINSDGELMVDDEFAEMKNLSEEVAKFIDNNGVDKNLSEKPNKAIISIKADRGTTYNSYIQALDGIKSAYAKLRAKHLGISQLEFTKLDLRNPIDRERLEKAKEAYPMMISEANPSQASH